MLYPNLQYTFIYTIDLINKSHNAPNPYPTMHHSEQKGAHFCSGMVHCGIWIRCIVGLVKQVYSTLDTTETQCYDSKDVGPMSGW